MLTPADITTLWLTFKVAGLATVLMLILGTPLAWWLARTTSRWKGVCNALVALPLVLPPTVLGFYLLILMGPSGPIGQLTTKLGLGTLPFTFTGLIVASVLYSLPFVVQPLQAAFAAIGDRPSVGYFFQRRGAIGPSRLFDRDDPGLCTYRRRVRRGTDGRRQYSR
jgi:molybdate transport system permease protein